MGPERHLRFVIAVVVSVLFLMSSWTDDDDPNGSGHSVKSSVKSAARRLGRSLGALDEDARKKKKNNHHQDRINYKQDYDNFLAEDEDDEDSDEASYEKSFRAKSQMYIRTNAFHFDLHACLPKFICEIHANAVSSDLTDLEKDIIGLFRNYVVLEGPGSPVYTYQLAAHMGQLVTGLDPSPCQGLYPSCPLSRPQLLDILRNVKSSRRMFY